MKYVLLILIKIFSFNAFEIKLLSVYNRWFVEGILDKAKLDTTKFRLDLNSTTPIVFDSVKISEEEKNQKFSVLYEGKQVDSYKIQTDLTLGENLKYSCYSPVSKVKGNKDFLPLGISDANEETLVFQLKRMNLIDKLQFTFVPSASSKLLANTGVVVFGEKEKTYKDYFHSVSVKIPQKNKGWKIHLNQFVVTDILDKQSSFQINTDVIFSPSTNEIIVPRDAFEFIIDIFFKENIKSGTCEVRGRVSERVLHCLCNHIYMRGKIDFQFREFTFSLPFVYLLDYYGDEVVFCDFLIVQGFTDEVILGTLFLNNFVTSFDYEEEKITFYQKDPFVLPKPSQNQDQVIKKLFVMLSLIEVAMIGILALQRRKEIEREK